MSTNYYHEFQIGDVEASIHLGKRSAGWRFLFHAYPDVRQRITTVRELATYLENEPGRIVSEYGEELDPVEFMRMARTWGQPDGRRATEYGHNRSHQDGEFDFAAGDWC